MGTSASCFSVAATSEVSRTVLRKQAWCLDGEIGLFSFGLFGGLLASAVANIHSLPNYLFCIKITVLQKISLMLGFSATWLPHPLISVNEIGSFSMHPLSHAGSTSSKGTEERWGQIT